MHEDWKRHGAAFLGAMLTLHQQGAMDVTCILTGGHKHAVVPSTFPVGKVARFLCGESCESIDRTLDAHAAVLRAADVVLVYTDGKISDGDINAAQWRSRGVDLIGCAVARSDAHATELRKSLSEHFHRALIGRGSEDVATKIVQYVTARTQSR